LTSDVKKVLIEVLTKLITDHQQKRAKITEEDVRAFMKIRQIKVDVPPNLVGDQDKEKAAAKPDEKKEAPKN